MILDMVESRPVVDHHHDHRTLHAQAPAQIELFGIDSQRTWVPSTKQCRIGPRPTPRPARSGPRLHSGMLVEMLSGEDAV